jgi:hypothetical protein
MAAVAMLGFWLIAAVSAAVSFIAFLWGASFVAQVAGTVSAISSVATVVAAVIHIGSNN